MHEEQPLEKRYFWSGWFDGHSFSLLAMLFVLFSAIDLYATMLLLQHRIIREGNALADLVLQRYGFSGFIAMKIILVLVVITSAWLVTRSNLRLGLGLLWAGILVMAVVILRHIAIMGVASS